MFWIPANVDSTALGSRKPAQPTTAPAQVLHTGGRRKAGPCE